MKVFFTGSPRALGKYRAEHEAIYRAIENFGATNVSNLVIAADPVKFYDREHDEVVDHYKSTIKGVKEADVVVAEVSLHSMSMGYVVNKALEFGKPVIVLYLPGFEPFFFSGINDEKLQILEYEKNNVDKILKKALASAQDQVDVRFNFFVSPQIMAFLDEVSKEKRVPRAVFIRELIENEMKKRGV